MSNPHDLSIVANWLEQKLKEYFAKKATQSSTWKIPYFSNLPYMKGVPIQTAIYDFRLLDFKLEIEPGDTLSEIADEILKVPNRADFEPYKRGNSHAYVVYQQGSQCVGRELLLHIYAAEIGDVNLGGLEARYILSLDEHHINVYTRIFPMLQDWAKRQNIQVHLSVPECYFGCFQTEESKPTETSDFSGDLFSDDLLNKIAGGMEYFEKMKKAEGSGKQSSYRILILEDICRQGFQQRNYGGSPFISLVNVQECLKCLAEIHSTSWAFCELRRKSFLKTWPFLAHPLYLPFVREQIIPGYFAVIGMIHDYLIANAMEENLAIEKIMSHLVKLGYRLDEVLERYQRPRTVTCLIHQDLCSSSLLFRYSMPSQKVGKIPKAGGGGGGGDGQADRNDNVKQGATSKSRGEPVHKSSLKREVMITNWRTASFGSPMIDVAFLLLTTLPPKTRQAETASLLALYWNAFNTYAKRFGLCMEWSEKDLLDDYLECLLYNCVLITGNIQETSSLDGNGMEAFLEAVKDLITAGVL